MNDKLNAICPYFAMFPLDYPMEIIKTHGGTSILDPFCGRGTTNMAARLNGLHSIGIDSSPVAYSIARSKMVDVTPEEIVSECARILKQPSKKYAPRGEFWHMMYNPITFRNINKVRQVLLEDCSTPERIALRGIMLGALHGPLRKNGTTSYLSNQFPRTFASKPDYSIRYWKSHGYDIPPAVDLLEVVKLRAERYYSEDVGRSKGFIYQGDSTEVSTFDTISDMVTEENKVDLIITSPPYVGMNTYIPDQWIRNWFVGGPSKVEYSVDGQIHSGQKDFIKQLNKVWKNCESLCKPKAKMAVRFGKVNSYGNDPLEVIRKTFDGTSWQFDSWKDAGKPTKGKRQCDSFLNSSIGDYNEIDVIASLT